MNQLMLLYLSLVASLIIGAGFFQILLQEEWSWYGHLCRNYQKKSSCNC